jgi:alkylhydroperoxidase family enzyme
MPASQPELQAATDADIARAFAERPAVLEAWKVLVGAIREHMDFRRYELATFAAAQRLRSSYCSLAHGTLLDEQLGEPVLAIVAGRASSGLSELDLAVMDLAERVVDDATAIGDSHRDRLRELGLTDAEILEVILAASARCFFSKTLDALGVAPHAGYAALTEEMRAALVVGRPIAGPATSAAS